MVFDQKFVDWARKHGYINAFGQLVTGNGALLHFIRVAESKFSDIKPANVEFAQAFVDSYLREHGSDLVNI